MLEICGFKFAKTINTRTNIVADFDLHFFHEM